MKVTETEDVNYGLTRESPSHEMATDAPALQQRLDLRKRVFQIPMLVGKGKRSTDLLEACGVLPLAQEPIGRQEKEDCGDRNSRQPPRQDIVSRCAREAVSRKVPAPRGLDQVGRKPLNVTALGAVLFIFHKYGGILHSQISFAITALIVRKAVRRPLRAHSE